MSRGLLASPLKFFAGRAAFTVATDGLTPPPSPPCSPRPSASPGLRLQRRLVQALGFDIGELTQAPGPTSTSATRPPRLRP